MGEGLASHSLDASFFLGGGGEVTIIICTAKRKKA